MKYPHLWRVALLTMFFPITVLWAAAPERVAYEAAFYAPFAPRTALDMVKQTPGFVLADEEELRRGFSGAVGNVLIDGNRLTAKSQTLNDVLQRVPAIEVVRIEVLRGSAVAGDASGQPVLVNVVRIPSSGGGVWGLGFEHAGEEPAPNGWFAWGGRRGVTDYSVGGSTYALERNLPGERAVLDGDGSLQARRQDLSPREFGEYALNGQVSRPLAGGRLTVTGQVGYSRYADQSSVLTTSPEGITAGEELIPYAESDRLGEAGLAFQRSLGRWELDVNALLTRKQYQSRVRATAFDAGGTQSSDFHQELEQDSGESILRATLAREGRGGRFEAGAELAMNTLAGGSRLTLDLGEGPFPIPIPNANLRVEENRVEAFVSRTLRIKEAWSLEARLAAESSELRFSGDTEQSVSLSYLKPRVHITRTLGAHQLQLRAFRDVSQLDFADFVSSAELKDDVLNGGNPDLRPQTAWAAELIGDFRLSKTAVRARLFHHWLDDVNDFIPAGTADERFDAPGNIGTGLLRGVEVALTLPLTRLLPGGTLNVSGTWQEAETHDPVTGELRGISGVIGKNLKTELRQDLPAHKLAWGVGFTDQSATTDWRLSEIDSRGKSSSLDLFVETTALAGFKLRLSMISALGDPETRDRRLYLPDRAGSAAGREWSERYPGHWWLLSVSGGF
jgi:hypothetical protein